MTEEIHYNDSLIRSLEDGLRSAFKQPNLRLNRKSSRHAGPLFISIVDADRTAAGDEGSEEATSEILLTNDERSGFYFGCRARFDLATSKYLLQHASLMVFQNIMDELVPLFRADWDKQAASDAGSKHAQPHWHFVQRPESIERIVRTVISPTEDFSPERSSVCFGGLADCGSVFHS